MLKCFSKDSFYVSELLVVLSSCLFIVTALITAVVSVTNTIFQDSGIYDSPQGVCQPPEKFLLNVGKVIPKHPENNGIDGPFQAILDVFELSLKKKLVLMGRLKQDEYVKLDINSVIEPIQGYLDKIFENDLKNSLLEKAASYFNSNKLFSLNHFFFPKSIIYTAALNATNYLGTIDQIKSIMYHLQEPVLFSIPIPISSSQRTITRSGEVLVEKNAEFGPESSFVIYGWTNDHLPRYPLDPTISWRGGFICKAFSSDIGTLPEYLFGSISTYEADTKCNSAPLKEDLYSLLCKDSKKCQKGELYRPVFYQKGSECFEDKKGNMIKLPIGSSATAFNNSSQDDCIFWFVPYELFQRSLLFGKQTPYASWINITWLLRRTNATVYASH